MCLVSASVKWGELHLPRLSHRWAPQRVAVRLSDTWEGADVTAHSLQGEGQLVPGEALWQ